MTGIGVGPAAVPTRINIKAGTYAQATTNVNWTTAGAAAFPVWWRGYKTTIGDQDANNLAVAGTDIPSIVWTGTGKGDITALHQWFSNIDFTGAPSGYVLAPTATVIYRCRIRNTSRNAAAIGLNLSNGNTNHSIVGCYISAGTTSGIIAVNINGGQFIGNYISGGSTGMKVLASPSAYYAFNVIDSPAGDAILLGTTSGGGVITNNSIYGPGGNGINMSAVVGIVVITNNHFENCNGGSKAAINNTTGTASDYIRCINNSYYNNTANISGQGDVPTPWDLGTLGGSGYVNPSAHNFTASTYLKAIAFPGAFETISAFTGYLDEGAVQRVEPAAGGGLLTHPGMTGGMRG